MGQAIVMAATQELASRQSKIARRFPCRKNTKRMPELGDFMAKLNISLPAG